MTNRQATAKKEGGASLLMPTLLMVVFINFVGIGALIPILPYTVIDQLGYSEIVMTSLLASFSLAMFIGNPILGRWSDKIGRKPVLMISLAVNAISHLVFAFSQDIIVLFAARIVAGLAAGNIGVIQAIIADQSRPEERAKYMGFMGAFIGAGFVFGPAIGGLLSGVGAGHCIKHLFWWPGYSHFWHLHFVLNCQQCPLSYHQKMMMGCRLRQGS